MPTTSHDALTVLRAITEACRRNPRHRPRGGVEVAAASDDRAWTASPATAPPAALATLGLSQEPDQRRLERFAERTGTPLRELARAPTDGSLTAAELRAPA
ncbi:MAG: hypothetical protein QOI78_8943 [Actinomycetota bacterium]|jgi:hypothetical protein|nr:hypothetical protein [Actinomycetota bacterium]